MMILAQITEQNEFDLTGQRRKRAKRMSESSRGRKLRISEKTAQNDGALKV